MNTIRLSYFPKLLQLIRRWWWDVKQFFRPRIYFIVGFMVFYVSLMALIVLTFSLEAVIR